MLMITVSAKSPLYYLPSSTIAHAAKHLILKEVEEMECFAQNSRSSQLIYTMLLRRVCRQ